jgi:hypothetical protein
VKTIDQYATLKEFTADIDQAGQHLPFKIMGKKRLPDPSTGASGVYYSASMLSEIYKTISDPDLAASNTSISAPFGEILSRGCRLDVAATYSSSITPNPKTNSNLLQADIFAFDLSKNGLQVPPHRLAMVITHSCGFNSGDGVSMVPVYLESELDIGTLTAIRNKPTKNTSVRGNLFSNEAVNFLGLPAAQIATLNSQADRMLACLHLQTVVPRRAVPQAPALRLTYRALSYFQLRLAVLYLRDVQDSDDTRDF